MSMTRRAHFECMCLSKEILVNITQKVFYPISELHSSLPEYWNEWLKVSEWRCHRRKSSDSCFDSVYCVTFVTSFKIPLNVLFLLIYCFLFSLLEVIDPSNLHLWFIPRNLVHLEHFQQILNKIKWNTFLEFWICSVHILRGIGTWCSPHQWEKNLLTLSTNDFPSYGILP